MLCDDHTGYWINAGGGGIYIYQANDLFPHNDHTEIKALQTFETRLLSFFSSF